MGFKSVYVKTIGTCNLNCTHCFTNGKDGDPTQFDVDTTVEWIRNYRDRVGDDNGWHFELHGGEPFLVKLHKLKEFVARVRDIIPDASFGCTSNLTFPVTDNHLSFMTNELRGQIGTSWDPYIRWETSKQYNQWKESIGRLTSHGLTPKVNVTITKELIEDYPPKVFFDTMTSLGVKSIEIERLTRSGMAICNSGSLFPDNDLQDIWFLDLLKYYQLYEIHRVVRVETFDKLIGRLLENRVEAGTNCRNCEQNLVTINSNGTLSTCPNSAEEVNYSSIKDDPVVFLNHNSRIVSQSEEQTWDERCITCDVFDICGGDCHKLNWDSRCGGWKRTLHYLSDRPYSNNLIFKG